MSKAALFAGYKTEIAPGRTVALCLSPAEGTFLLELAIPLPEGLSPAEAIQSFVETLVSTNDESLVVRLPLSGEVMGNIVGMANKLAGAESTLMTAMTVHHGVGNA